MKIFCALLVVSLTHTFLSIYLLVDNFYFIYFKYVVSLFDYHVYLVFFFLFCVFYTLLIFNIILIESKRKK